MIKQLSYSYFWVFLATRVEFGKELTVNLCISDFLIQDFQEYFRAYAIFEKFLIKTFSLMRLACIHYYI